MPGSASAVGMARSDFTSSFWSSAFRLLRLLLEWQGMGNTHYRFTAITMDRSAIIGKRWTVTSWSLFFDVHRAVPQGTEGYSVLHLCVKLLRRQCKHELSLERAGLASSPPSHPVETQTLELTCSVMHCSGGAYYGYAKRNNDYRVGRHHGTLLIQSSS